LPTFVRENPFATPQLLAEQIVFLKVLTSKANMVSLAGSSCLAVDKSPLLQSFKCRLCGFDCKGWLALVCFFSIPAANSHKHCCTSGLLPRQNAGRVRCSFLFWNLTAEESPLLVPSDGDLPVPSVGDLPVLAGGTSMAACFLSF
jgi:hypothetical protein